MKKLIKWILIVLLAFYLISAVAATPVSWIGLLITVFGIYQLRQKKKGKVTFSKPGWIVGVGFILTFILAITFVEPVEETAKDIDTENTEEKLANEEIEKEKQAEEDQELKDDAEKLTTEQKAKEDQVKQEATKKKEDVATKLGLVAKVVSRVVDGDTLELSDGSKIRLVGVNTPESTTRHEDYGKEASEYASSKLAGKQIYIQKDVSDTDRYDRLLRLVWLDIPTDVMDENEIRTKMFNADLVINGYAEPSTYPPDVKYSDYFLKFAREARENNSGLWAFGENGTTKGDLDEETVATNNNEDSSSTQTTTAEPEPVVTESFQNCTELRKVYPNGVDSNHPAYDSKHDRDKDNFACEKN